MKRMAIFSCFFFVAACMLRAQAESDVQKRLKADEDRISALESEIKVLKAALTAAPSASTAAQQGAPAPAPSTAEQAPAQAPSQPQKPPITAEQAPPTVAANPALPGESAGQLPVYGGASAAAKALNPDISVIGDFLGSIGRNPTRPVPSLQMHESEVGLQAIVDPYARADFFLSFGEEGVNLEEGYITFTALPAGFVAKVGKMRAAFGKVNTLHNQADVAVST